MGSAPTKAQANILCHCRMEAAKWDPDLKKRETAAERLNVSVSTLASWELEDTKIVPAERIRDMAALYKAPHLENYYCTEICPLGSFIPKMSLESLDRIALRSIALMKKIPDLKAELIDIVADGIISEDEKPRLEVVMKHLDELSAAAQDMKAWVLINIRDGD